MKTTILTIIAALSGFSLVGCASLDRKMKQSDGFGEFALALCGREQPNICAIKLIPGCYGKVATGHVRKDARGVYVSGYVEKAGPGGVTATWSHIDVVVLDAKGRQVKKTTTKFFPSEVPASQRGVAGRSRYFVRLPSEPSNGSTIEVSFHPAAMSECESVRKM